MSKAHAAEDPACSEPTPNDGTVSASVIGIDKKFVEHEQSEEKQSEKEEHPARPRSAADFKKLVQDFEEKQEKASKETSGTAEEQQQGRVKELIDHHLSDGDWEETINKARQAAELGQKEYMMHRFPSQLCSDGGRAINVREPEWPKTLRGEPAELYQRWGRDLKPQGFYLEARVLEFPDGFPGDIGLFLVWGRA